MCKKFSKFTVCVCVYVDGGALHMLCTWQGSMELCTDSCKLCSMLCSLPLLLLHEWSPLCSPIYEWVPEFWMELWPAPPLIGWPFPPLLPLAGRGWRRALRLAPTAQAGFHSQKNSMKQKERRGNVRPWKRKLANRGLPWANNCLSCEKNKSFQISTLNLGLQGSIPSLVIRAEQIPATETCPQLVEHWGEGSDRFISTYSTIWLFLLGVREEDRGEHTLGNPCEVESGAFSSLDPELLADMRDLGISGTFQLQGCVLMASLELCVPCTRRGGCSHMFRLGNEPFQKTRLMCWKPY